MLDEIVEFVLDMLLELVPNVVWKILLCVLGVVMTAVGATIVTESTRVGVGVIAVGTFLFGGSLVSLYR